MVRALSIGALERAMSVDTIEADEHNAARYTGLQNMSPMPSSWRAHEPARAKRRFSFTT